MFEVWYGARQSLFRVGAVFLSMCWVFEPGSVAAQASVEDAMASLEKGDVAGAVSEFREAFDAGDADGAFYIGRLFEMGLGTEPNL